MTLLDSIDTESKVNYNNFISKTKQGTRIHTPFTSSSDLHKHKNEKH